MNIRSEEIRNAVQSAGVIGAGGGGFPTHIKLDTKVDTVIANGSECEPLLNTDKTFLKEYPSKIIDGLKYVMKATGAKKGYIAIKAYYKDVVNEVEKAIPKGGDISVHLQDNYYPAGDEFFTVFDVTGRIIPEGGLPLQVGVVVNNVVSLAQIADAVNGKPVTERPITIAGSVKNPQVLTVPIGTKYNDLIKMAGGTLNPTDILIDGGPMMGTIVKELNSGISKTTSGIIALPADHFIIKMNSITISQMVKKSKAACCQCVRCTDLCTRNLIGHKLYPHKTMRTIDYNMPYPTEHITSAFLCSQCGVCELIACDVMQLSPRKVYQEYQNLLLSKGIKNPHTSSNISALSEIEYRKVPIPVVLKKLHISEYSKPSPSVGYKKANIVRIPINKHIGVPAKPIIETGVKVRMGDIIAQTPTGKLGAIYHASIAGKIINITEEWIEIENDGALE